MFWSKTTDLRGIKHPRRRPDRASREPVSIVANALRLRNMDYKLRAPALCPRTAASICGQRLKKKTKMIAVIQP